MGRRALVWLCASGLTAGALALACSSFDSSPEDPSDASPDRSTDSCVSCAQETGSPDAYVDAGAEAGDPVLEVSAGDGFGCARLASKKVVCWGRNNEGQIGRPGDPDFACDGTSRCMPKPVEVSGLTDVTHLSAGADFACARTSAGVVKCWGQNNKGNLGLGTAMPLTRSSAEPVPGLPPALDVAAGAYNACARVTEDGGTEVYCWGGNGVQLLGPTTDGIYGPTRIAGLTGAKSVALDLTGELACAILADDTVVCWGHNGYGGLGHLGGTTGDGAGACPGGGGAIYCNPTPKPVAGGGFKASEIAVGYFFACARELGSGKVSCWGHNRYGCLGRGPADAVNSFPTPLEVPGLGVATALAAKRTHVCAIVAGTVHCWGTQTFGELGNGNASDVCGATPCKTSAQKVNTIVSADRIATGGNFTSAHTTDGWDYAWGANIDGRLGHTPGQSGDLATCYPAGARCNPVPQRLTLP